MISRVIIDDEKHAIEILKEHISKLPSLKLVYSSTKPIEAFQFVQQNPVDLIFLDIHMPDLEGIQFVKLLQGKKKVILTTAYPEYALEGYEHNVIDYLLKPIMFDRFLKAVQKVINADNNFSPLANLNTNSEKYFFVKTENRGKMTKVLLDEIMYVEGLGNYVNIFTTTQKILTLITFKELEDQLPGNLFFRIHKSYLINIEKIEGVDGNQITINEVHIPIGDKYKDKFYERIDTKIINKKKL
jgi:DNA-binding LytR/AlgR family response regulator